MEYRIFQTNEPIFARFGEVYCILCSISRLHPPFWTNMLHFVQRKLVGAASEQ
jgi:hypothetical protein